jgi:chromosome segregation ATPase
MNIHLEPEFYDATYKQHSYVNTISTIEGFETDKITEQTYDDLNNDIKMNSKYSLCNLKNNLKCAEMNNEVKNQQTVFNANLDAKNKAYIDLNRCKTKITSCTLLYNDINRKTNEFNNIYERINELDNNLNLCTIKKSDCKKIKKSISEVQRQIAKFEKELKELKERASQNRC